MPLSFFLITLAAISCLSTFFFLTWSLLFCYYMAWAMGFCLGLIAGFYEGISGGSYPDNGIIGGLGGPYGFLPGMIILPSGLLFPGYGAPPPGFLIRYPMWSITAGITCLNCYRAFYWDSDMLDSWLLGNLSMSLLCIWWDRWLCVVSNGVLNPPDDSLLWDTSLSVRDLLEMDYLILPLDIFTRSASKNCIPSISDPLPRSGCIILDATLLTMLCLRDRSPFSANISCMISWCALV